MISAFAQALDSFAVRDGRAARDPLAHRWWGQDHCGHQWLEGRTHRRVSPAKTRELEGVSEPIRWCHIGGQRFLFQYCPAVRTS